MYTYCNNNPVNYSDPSGEVALTAGVLSAFLTVALAVTVAITTSYTSKSVSDALSTSFQNTADRVSEQIILHKVAIMAVGYSLRSAIENSKARSTSKDIVNSNNRNQSTPKYWTADLVNKKWLLVHQ